MCRISKRRSPQGWMFSKATECCHVVVLWEGTAAPACGRMAPSRSQREACTLRANVKDASNLPRLYILGLSKAAFVYLLHLSDCHVTHSRMYGSASAALLWDWMVPKEDFSQRRWGPPHLSGFLRLLCHRQWCSAPVASGSHCCLVMGRHVKEQGDTSRNAMINPSFPGKRWIM